MHRIFNYALGLLPPLPATSRGEGWGEGQHKKECVKAAPKNEQAAAPHAPSQAAAPHAPSQAAAPHPNPLPIKMGRGNKYSFFFVQASKLLSWVNFPALHSSLPVSTSTQTKTARQSKTAGDRSPAVLKCHTQLKSETFKQLPYRWQMDRAEHSRAPKLFRYSACRRWPPAISCAACR